jgi:protein-S-isoprenylcysteine O-methyltransferase Ste14
MDPTLLFRIALPALFLSFVLVVMVWPVLRLRRETGVLAITLHRETAPGQRPVALVFTAIHLAVGALAVVAAVRGPEMLGLWPLPLPLRWLGLALALAGLAFVAVAQRQMGASFRIGIDDMPTALVERGLFRVVRNPIFSGMLVMFAGMFLAVPCAWTLGLGIAAGLTVARQVRLEERHLLSLHGDAYCRYASRVGRFVPGIGRLRDARQIGRSARV